MSPHTRNSMSQLSYLHIDCQSSFKLEIPEELSGRTIQNCCFCKVDKRVEYSNFSMVNLHNQIPDCPLLIPPSPCSDTASWWMSIWDQLPSPSWSLGKYTVGTPVHPKSLAFNPSPLCPQGENQVGIGTVATMQFTGGLSQDAWSVDHQNLLGCLLKMHTIRC